MPVSRFRYPLVIGAALLAGIVCGRLLHGSVEEKDHHKETRAHPSSGEKNASAFGTGGREARADARTQTASPVPFIVPAAAMSRIRLNLMEGTSLDRKECEILGLGESQIQALEDVVSPAVSRWKEREKATMKIIPSAGGNTIIHIPPADPAISEEEWQDLKASMLEIGGKDLDPLLRYRLTDGYSPTSQSNAWTGMLNVLTAGYGTLERMVRITPSQDGETTYEIIDIFPDRRKGAEVDETFFKQVKDSGSYEGTQHYHGDTVPAQLSHLLPAK
jgi:hypothetical protein